MQLPASAAIIVAVTGSPTAIAIISSEKQAIEDTPHARPSSPSIRLTAFVIATIQITVTGMDRKPRLING